jgi:hypothetical protein
MRRLVPSLAAVLVGAALAAPAHAADWDEGDVYLEKDFRGAYVNEPKDWMGMGDEYDPIAIELGLRYWYSWGAQNFASGGNSLGIEDQSHIGEAHLRIEDHSSNSFAKAIAGYSIAVSGSYAAPLDSGTISDGTIAYAGLDFGWNPWGDQSGSGFGGLVGYQYWNNSPDSGRNNFTTATSSADITFDPDTGQTFLPGDSAPNSVEAHMLRLGIQGKASFGDFIDVTGELVGVPYAKIGGQVGIDDPMFNCDVYCGPAQAPYGFEAGNISFIRSSPTEIDGWGYGAMAELWLGVHPTENITFRLGGRAWYLQGTVDATYTAASIGNPSDSDGGNPPDFDTPPTFVNMGFIETNNPFSMLRYGLLAELTYAF